ncbi:MAG: ImmA/IrrE family metallo-endopeptidase [Alphaproteobacteria bacterium]|nr:ImmA/IrrE family metallo-endopeptidase [Alphaproteobacteria bacterium]
MVKFISNDAIAQAAKQISDLSPPDGCEYAIDVVGCATQVLGLQIHFEDLEALTGEKAMGLILPKEHLILCDRSLEPVGPKGQHNDKVLRFTVGHEIGHFCFHPHHMDDENTMLFHKNLPSKERNRLEIQANKFAACLAMPEYDVRIAYTTFREHFESEGAFIDEFLSERFGLSKESARYRAQNLGIPGPFSDSRRSAQRVLPRPVPPRFLGHERAAF